MNVSAREDLAPLTPQAFHVLLALSKGKMHGYDIKRQVETDSSGVVEMRGSGAVYATLKRLEGLRLVEVVEVHPASGPTGESRYYHLTSMGEHVLDIEIKRYQRAVSLYLDRR